jgi:hypothetical protein
LLIEVTSEITEALEIIRKSGGLNSVPQELRMETPPGAVGDSDNT